MKILHNINAKRKLKNMNESLNQVFFSTDIESFQNNLINSLKIHEQAESSLDEEYLFPDGDEEKMIFSKNVWINIDTINFLKNYSSNIIADSLIQSIGSFYIQPDKHIKLLFANFILDGLIMAQNHYKNNWKEYMSRYFEIQSNITSFVEKNISVEGWKNKPNHPFNYQYPSYYLFTAFKEEIEHSEKFSITHYDRALIKLALLNKNNPEVSQAYIQKAISLYGNSVISNGEANFFKSPLNKVIYEDEMDRLKDYSFITNQLNQDLENLEAILK